MAESFAQKVERKRRARMAAIDQMQPEIRELVYDYGLTVVRAIMDQGVIKPKKIRHIVETVLNEFSPTWGSYSSQGTRAQGNGEGR